MKTMRVPDPALSFHRPFSGEAGIVTIHAPRAASLPRN
jgi:hypothetical protein